MALSQAGKANAKETSSFTSSIDRIQLDIQDLRNPWVLRLPYPSRTNSQSSFR
ncbi:predicted protein [Sclerotinia sclerotiorum 1980 UF-70]|uniref:Uncharacterized protein n=1 Tax=Sclerotinia sclerotiorum (strain ATCC 18683 / 1980 / Ss-1) TaxID=665079 RepID=A7EYN7_SCLS1|nr:predicted protein [Sclerotinia sclerotiorum 1980 UF-70]EDN94579.1 predicted protein [Sclerotinia sclerotiorum 1980 UF-70]